jgi:hypothetical protein
MAGTAELSVQQMIKPLVCHNLRDYGIIAIEDIQLVEQEMTQSVLLIVLYKSNIEKIVGTRARYPVSKLSVFELTYGKAGKAADQDQAGVTDLKLLHTIADLSYYSSRILPAMPIDDFCYVLTPFSVLLIRLEKNRVNEIQTSSAAIAIAEHFSSDPNKPFELTASKTERSVLNYTA